MLVLSWILLVLPCVGVDAGRAFAEPPRPSSADIAACVRDPGCHRTFVVAHRAKGFGAPENSRAAVGRAVAAGVPIVGISVRASSDGEMFVLHDRDLRRETTLEGRIDEVPAARLAQALLKNGEPLPRFSDLYALVRGRTVLTVGFKVDLVSRLADWIHAHGSFDDVIFFVNTGEQMQAAARAKGRYPEVMVMVRLLDTRVTVESTKAVFGRSPEIFHTEPLGAKQVSDLQARGGKVFMNVLRSERLVPPLNYLAIWRVLSANPDFVQTDEPVRLMHRVATNGR